MKIWLCILNSDFQGSNKFSCDFDIFFVTPPKYFISVPIVDEANNTKQKDRSLIERRVRLSSAASSFLTSQRTLNKSGEIASNSDSSSQKGGNQSRIALKDLKIKWKLTMLIGSYPIRHSFFAPIFQQKWWRKDSIGLFGSQRPKDSSQVWLPIEKIQSWSIES